MMRTGCAVIPFFLCTSVAFAQDIERYLDLSIDRPLTPEELTILSEVLVQNSLPITLPNNGSMASGNQGLSLDDWCKTPECRAAVTPELPSDRASIQTRTISVEGMDYSEVDDLFAWNQSTVVPGEFTDDGNDYIISSVPSPSGEPTFRGFQVDDWKTFAKTYSWQQAITPESPPSVVPIFVPNSVPTQLIQSDLLRSGFSRRSFPINPEASQEAILEAIAKLENSGREAKIQQGADSAPTTMIDPTEVVVFEGEADASNQCQTDASGREWPFVAQDVVEILAFNKRLAERLKLPVRRSTIVVADTGLGPDLTTSGSGLLSKMLSLNYAEALNVPIVYENSSQAPGSWDCSDNDSNSYFYDLYGAVGSLNQVAECAPGEEPSHFNPALGPLSKLPDTNETYEPSHGSFVTALAVGGVNVLRQYPEISEQIGITTFRVTSPPQTGVSTKSVFVETSDMFNALAYAAGQRADVLNFSMKTTDDNFAGQFERHVAGSPTLLVTSAGNQEEDLEDPVTGVYPAGLIDDNLIVVGGLTPDEQRTWWLSSAHGPTNVNIAAPAVRVPSVDQHGNRVCFSGTSAAAPLVSFTAATLFSYGVFHPKAVRNRILSSGEVDRVVDKDKTLNGRVLNGKRLDIVAAMDIFVDRVEMDGEVRRGRLIFPEQTRLMKICSGASPVLAGSSGMVDPVRLRSWYRFDGKAKFEVSTRKDALSECDVPGNTKWKFWEIGQPDPVDLDVERIDSVVMSLFRSNAVQTAVLGE